MGIVAASGVQSRAGCVHAPPVCRYGIPPPSRAIITAGHASRRHCRIGHHRRWLTEGPTGPNGPRQFPDALGRNRRPVAATPSIWNAAIRCPASDPETIAELDRLRCGCHFDRDARNYRRLSADQAQQGPRLDSRTRCDRAGPEDLLGLCAVRLCRGQLRLDGQGRVAGPGRSRLLCRFLRSERRRRIASSAYASLVNLQTGARWFNVVQSKIAIFGPTRAPRKWSTGWSAG